MKYVNSGEGKIPLISLLAILAISLTINLPGLAVSPMLGHLRHVFHSSELESQLLTSLPNLVMIPVVLIAGRIATPKWQTAVLTSGLAIFLLSGVMSLFASSMGMLIFLGCLGGVGCGLVVPIAAGMISEWFVAKPRQNDLGLKSTTSNAMVIIANLYVGWVAVSNWHAAFAVYLVPIIPLVLVPFLTQKYIRKHGVFNSEAAASASAAATKNAKAQEAYHFQGSESTRLLVGLIILYVLLTYATTSISYYAPFMMEKYGMSTSQAGIVTAAYYLMVAVSGAFVGSLKRFFGRPVMFICLGIIAIGLGVIGFTKSYLLLIISSLLVGFAYGIVQPVIYNKTTYIAPSQKAGMTYFGYVLSSNYLSIMMVPFVDGFFRKIFHSTSPGFEFVFSAVVVCLLLAWALLEHKNYVFAVNPATAAPSEQEVQAAEAAEKILDKKDSAK
ncbi:MAG: MFS transporter [Muribaculaceae bacterium]|nr:MFS transporter [Muribaculaceae bacterium]